MTPDEVLDAFEAVQARAASAKAKYTRIAYRKKKEEEGKEPPPRTLGTLRRCWCGEPNGHDWPGKDEGKGHPR